MSVINKLRYLFENWRRAPRYLFRKMIIDPVFAARRRHYLFLRSSLSDMISWYSLKNRHKGEAVVICGNGPSLAQVDFSCLSKFTTFGSNKIFLKQGWWPTYYSVEDDLVLTQNEAKIREYKGPVKLFPASMLSVQPRQQDTTYFEFSTKKFYPNEPKFICEEQPYPSWGSTIVYTQIQLAIWMGASKIILVGVDFNFNVPSGIGKTTKELISTGEINHFHPDYRKPGERWNLPNLHFQEISFRVALANCQELGVELINASPGTKLRVIPQVTLNDVGLESKE